MHGTIISRSEARRRRLLCLLCVDYIVIVMERLADGFLGVKHGVAAFVIQFLDKIIVMLLLLVVAVDHSRLVDKILVRRSRSR